MAEAVYRVGELGEDGRVDVGRAVEDEDIDQGLHLAGELLEHEVLILHLGGEARGLKQALALPVQRVGEGQLIQSRQGGEVRRKPRDVGREPLVDKGRVRRAQDGQLLRFDLAIVLRVEHVMNGGQADILVAAPVAGGEVGVQQFVVIGHLSATEVRGDRIARHVIGISLDHQGPGRGRVAVRVEHRAGHGGVGDVVEKGVRGAHRAEIADPVDDDRGGRHGDQIDRVGCCPGDDDVVAGVRNAVRPKPEDDLGVAGRRVRDEASIGVGAQQGNVEHILVAQFDAQHGAGLGLDVAPGPQPAGRPVQQPACGHGPPVHRGVFTQEDLMRGMGGVGLVLVHKGGGDVQRLVRRVVGGAHDPVGAGTGHGGRAAHHHEGVLRPHLVSCAGHAVGTVRPQGIIGRQGDVDGAVVGLGDQVQAVIEELAEEGHPGVEGRSQPLVRRHIGNDQRAVFGLQTLGLQHGVELGLSGFARGLLGGGVQSGVGVDRGQRSDQGRMGGPHHLQIAIDVGRARKGQGGDDGGRIGEAHVRDQVRDQARIGVRDIARMAAVHPRRGGADHAVVVIGDRLAAAQRHAVVALIDEV